jgi:AcrR family transcriptional regulator
VSARPLSEEQQAVIRATVRELAHEGGFDGWRIADVVERTGVSSRTLYKYFPSKDFLLLDSVLDVAERILTRVEAVAHDDARPPAERVHGTLATLSEQIIASPPLAQATVRALMCGSGEIAPILEVFEHRVRALLRASLTGATDDDDERDGLAETLQQVWFTAMLSWAVELRGPEYMEDSVRRAVAQLGIGHP